MDLAIILANIDRLLIVKGITEHRASKLAGVPDAIRNIRRKLNGEIPGDGITIKTLEALARGLETTAEELKRPPPRISGRPIIGLKETIRAKIEWLDKQRSEAMRELEAIEAAERLEKKPAKRKAR